MSSNFKSVVACSVSLVLGGILGINVTPPSGHNTIHLVVNDYNQEVNIAPEPGDVLEWKAVTSRNGDGTPKLTPIKAKFASIPAFSPCTVAGSVSSCTIRADIDSSVAYQYDCDGVTCDPFSGPRSATGGSVGPFQRLLLKVTGALNFGFFEPKSVSADEKSSEGSTRLDAAPPTGQLFQIGCDTTHGASPTLLYQGPTQKTSISAAALTGVRLTSVMPNLGITIVGTDASKPLSSAFVDPSCATGAAARSTQCTAKAQTSTYPQTYPTQITATGCLASAPVNFTVTAP